MKYTAPQMAFQLIKQHKGGDPVRLFDDGETQVYAVYEDDDVGIYAEDDIQFINEMHVAPNEDDVALAVSAIYETAGVSVDVYDDVDEFGNPHEDEDPDYEQRINEVEAGYDELIEGLIYEIVPAEFADVTDEVIEDIKNAVLGILGFKYGFVVFRPSFIQNEKGETVYSEHPYQEMPQK